jgi:hypothetical protein
VRVGRVPREHGGFLRRLGERDIDDIHRTQRRATRIEAAFVHAQLGKRGVGQAQGLAHEAAQCGDGVRRRCPVGGGFGRRVGGTARRGALLYGERFKREFELGEADHAIRPVAIGQGWNPGLSMRRRCAPAWVLADRHQTGWRLKPNRQSVSAAASSGRAGREAR